MMTRSAQIARRRKVGTFGFFQGGTGITGATVGPLTSYTYSPQFQPVGVTAATSMTLPEVGSTGVVTLPMVPPGSTTASLPAVTVAARGGLSGTQKLVIGVALALAAFLLLSSSPQKR